MDKPDVGVFAFMGLVVLGLCIMQTGAFIRIPADSNNIQTNDEKDVYIQTTTLQSTHYRWRRSADEFPDDIDVDLSNEGLHTHFTLHRNRDVTDNVAVLLSRNGHIYKHRVVSREPVAYYANPENGASFMVSESNGDTATENFKLFGMFNDLTDSTAVEYLVQPPDSTHNKHTISRIIEKQSIVADYLSIPDVELQDVVHVPHEQKNITSRREKRSTISYEVEIFFVIDYLIYQDWYTISEGEADRHLATIEYIKQFFGFILNSMTLRYESVAGSDYTITCLYAGIKLFADGDPSFVTDNLLPDPADGPYVDIIANDVIRAFKAWAEANLTTVAKYDHAIFFTGYTMGTNDSGTLDDSVIGMAFKPLYDTNNHLLAPGVCGDHKYSIIEAGGYSVNIAAISAHELGHNLGATHDQYPANDCSADDGNIMAPYSVVTYNSINNLRLWIFSTCSRDYFTAYLTSLTAYLNARSLGNCMTSRDSLDPSGLDPYLGQLAGQVYGPDTQCEKEMGSGSFMYRGFFVNDYSLFCSLMPCMIDSYGTGYTLSMPWDGTTCGNGKVCVAGYCVSSAAAPAVDDEACLFGDVPGDVPTKSLTCQEYLGTHSTAYHCYDDIDKGNCCDTCEQIRLANIPLGITGCPYGDHLSVCSDESLELRICYFGENPSNAEICCQFCSENALNNPNCAYGDKWEGCVANYCDLYSEPFRDEWCCLTCPALTTNSTTTPTTTTTTPTTTTTTPTTTTTTPATTTRRTTTIPTTKITPTSTPTTPTMSTTTTTTNASTTPSTAPSNAVAAILVFPINTHNVHLTSAAIQQNVLAVLRYYFDKVLEGRLEDLVIQYIHARGGSLIIGYEIEYEDSAVAASEFTKANIDLMSGQETVTILNETVSATSIQINSINVTKDTILSSAKVCEVFKAVNGPCQEDYYCTVEQELPVCFPDKAQYGLFLVIAVIASVFVSIVLVYFIIRAYRHRTYEQHQESLLASSTELNDIRASNKRYGIFHIPLNSQGDLSSNKDEP